MPSDLIATITIDPEENRAMISGDSEYTITARPGNDICDEQVVEVKVKLCKIGLCVISEIHDFLPLVELI